MKTLFRNRAKYIKYFLFIIIFAQSILAYQTERVVLVVVDGLRYSEGLGDPDHEFVPRMSELAAQGAIVDDFQNDGFTWTSRAIPAIWCGGWTETYSFSDPDCGGSNNNYTELPTVFEYYRRELSRPAEDCVYALKELCPWKASFHPEYGPDFWPLYHSVGSTDTDVWHETEQIIATLSPHLLLMYLADVDHAGHVGNWDEYTHTISIADSLIGELWDTIQANPDYQNKTTLLVTNDHGRHGDDFTGHGDGCAGCRQIQLLAIGPDIYPGLVSDIPRAIPDITATIGELLGFATEYATGTAMQELIDETVGIENTTLNPAREMMVYPNPTNLGTSVDFIVPSAGRVSIQVFDLMGRQRGILIDDYLEAGPLNLSWNGRDGRGNPMPSGTYLMRLETPATLQFKKIVFIK